MRKLLWIGDADCETGFAKSTHYVLNGLIGKWDISVLGMNYRGDPHDWPYPIYPCWPGRDMFGVGRLGEMCELIKPDLIVIQNDPWNVPAYMKKIAQLDPIPTVVGFIAVDGLNCRGMDLNGLHRAVFWTHFAQEQALLGGMVASSGVVPLGVDLEMFNPGDKMQARKNIGLPERIHPAFIFGNVNRNQPRKRMDLTIRYFGQWVRDYGIKKDEAFLYLHSAPTGELEYDLVRLGRYYGIAGDPNTAQLITASPKMWSHTPEKWVRETLRAFDLQGSTALGEGWGLTAMEGMACGIAQLLPRHSAFAEWASGAAMFVPCTGTEANPMSVIGKVADEDAFMAGLEEMYHDSFQREFYAKAGLARVTEPRYRWWDISSRFAEELELAWQEAHSGV